jgi:hypothetical protein
MINLWIKSLTVELRAWALGFVRHRKAEKGDYP